MSKFVSALTLAFIFVATMAHAGIAIVNDSGTSSGSRQQYFQLRGEPPAGVEDGDLVVVAIASDTRATPPRKATPPESSRVSMAAPTAVSNFTMFGKPVIPPARYSSRDDWRPMLTR